MNEVIYKSNNGLQALPLDAVLGSKQRIVFLTDEITNQSALETIKQLIYLEDTDPGPIKLVINSPGGSVTAGLTLAYHIQSSPVEINTICFDYCASMAAIILAVGKKRSIIKGSKVLIHQASGSELSGRPAKLLKAVESLVDLQDVLDEILAEATGKTIEEIRKAVSFNNLMTCEEALGFGLVDELICHI